jgi:hypothetical protein
MLLGQHNTGSVRPTSVRTISRARSQTLARARDQDAENRQAYIQGENRTQAQTRQQPDEPPTETIEQTPQADERLQADQQDQAEQRQQSYQPPFTYNNFERFREHTPAYPRRPQGQSVPSIMPSGNTDPYKAVPLIEFSNEKLNPKIINVFTKM